MAVEVRQMVVKSNVLQRSERDNAGDEQNMDELRKAILEECRAMIREALQERQER
ncbi:MAG: DUF5908 family protein [Burkholderiales bacterium]